jgi:hypothetical protein
MLYRMAGRHFCVPFSDPRDADTCMMIGQSCMFDNGKFGAHTRGLEIDEGKLFAWIEPRLGHPHWAVVLDEIDGTVEQQRAMVAQWPFPKALRGPVWHLALPVEYLFELIDAGWPRICVGSSGRYWQVGSDEWRRRIEDVFDALARTYGAYLPWLHMLRGLNLAGDIYPFASADSVNVARNYKDSNTCPDRMARNIDARQSPVRWNPRLKQMEIAYG